ncbi:uncharacterized protein LOC122082174 [Macadamia integrifolia]|uniref:uncharacterized protein LOC122082174 n=1 Tax=Macadamia integrifolia TaxID=60698 RepID=UPI001C4EFE29|nr:uncharacterized protein LOC122082174 [Macadamia integrifolia]
MGNLRGLFIFSRICEKIALICEWIQVAQSKQKSYADNRRRDLELEKGDLVFLRVAPMKGVMRFEKKGKFNPRYIRLFEILERVGNLAYRLILPPAMKNIHNTFHVSMLKKFVHDPSHILSNEPLDLKVNMTYEESPIQILDRKDQVLRNPSIPLVKVLWKNHTIEEASWE